jgi:pimeloyl-ACP methyl ester carboxylesterase
VLVDLRGHGKSTGKRIYFGTREVEDLKALLDQLEREGKASDPISVVGHSFGAVLALRWKAEDERIGRVVAMAPYANLSRAVLSVADQYARWVPKWFLKAGLRALPELVGAEPCELDPGCWMKAEEGVLFVAGKMDKISTPDQVEELRDLGGAGDELISVEHASHEALPFYFQDLAGPVGDWLEEKDTLVRDPSTAPPPAGD